jgi:hypothetical protein
MAKKKTTIKPVPYVRNPIRARYNVIEIDMQVASPAVEEAWRSLWWHEPPRGYSKFPHKGHTGGTDEEYDLVWNWLCSLDERLEEVDPRDFDPTTSKIIGHSLWVIINWDW